MTPIWVTLARLLLSWAKRSPVPAIGTIEASWRCDRPGLIVADRP
jgi:hypothetical protein